MATTIPISHHHIFSYVFGLDHPHVGEGIKINNLMNRASGKRMHSIDVCVCELFAAQHFWSNNTSNVWMRFSVTTFSVSLMYESDVMFNEVRLEHDHNPMYFGVKLVNTLTNYEKNLQQRITCLQIWWKLLEEQQYTA